MRFTAPDMFRVGLIKAAACVATSNRVDCTTVCAQVRRIKCAALRHCVPYIAKWFAWRAPNVQIHGSVCLRSARWAPLQLLLRGGMRLLTWTMMERKEKERRKRRKKKKGRKRKRVHYASITPTWFCFWCFECFEELPVWLQ